MMKHLSACLLVLSAAASAFADPPSLKEARERWLRGNYEEARAAYEALTKDAKERPAASVGLSKALQSQGKYDEALAAVEAALKDDPKHADLLARQAELLHLRGRWDEAGKSAKAALAIDKEHFLAHWVRAQLNRDKGDLKNADAECRWFVRTYTERSNNDKDVKDPDELLLVGLAGAENARWHNLSDQLNFILNDIYGDALKGDKSFWPAEYQAGTLLLEKYNRGEALPAFNKALAINPSAAEALVGKGIAALMKFEIKEAETLAEQALKINPNLPEALRLRADVHLAGGDAASALHELETARKVSPRDERTLGRIAACLYLQRKDGEAEELAKEVAAFDAKPALFFFEMADRLEERRRFNEAEKFYRKAAELRSNVPGAANSLGLLLLRLGREKEAADLLTKGFEADPFNVRVSNSLKVLRHLEKYETLQTPHFTVRHDKGDADQARLMGEYLENIYADLSKKFNHEPKERILIEVFTTHEMFSGRIVSLPDLHTIGACTGRIVGLVSPHGKGVRKPFNWARVLRHEVVHVFNLEQTNFLVPHWLTEGLAVSNEGFKRPPQWNQLLLERVPADDLMNLDTIDFGFIRPRTPLDWQMAYCQSLLYVEFIKDKFKPESIGQLLAAYRDGLDTGAAIAKVCKVDKAAFEKGYREFLQETVKDLRKGKPPEKRRTLAELKKLHEEKPDDLDVTAALAEAVLPRDRIQARQLAEDVTGRKRNHPLANYVLARLARLGGDVRQERDLLERGRDKDNPEPKLLLALGKVYYDAMEFAKAAEVYEQGRAAEPYENEWLLRLARVYAQTGDKDKQIAVMKDLVQTDADDLDHRKRLARMLEEAGRHDEAEQFARQTLEIDVRDKDAREILDKALRAQKKDGEAERMRMHPRRVT